MAFDLSNLSTYDLLTRAWLFKEIVKSMKVDEFALYRGGSEDNPGSGTMDSPAEGTVLAQLQTLFSNRVNELESTMNLRLAGKASASHTHDDRYYTEKEIDDKLSSIPTSEHRHTVSDISDFPASLPANGGNANTVGGKSASEFAASSHNHDSRYYTETEMDTKLSGKSDTSHTHSDYAASSHNHDSRYYTETEMDTKLNAKLSTSGGTISGNLTVTGTITANGNITGAKVYNAVWSADYAEGFSYEGEIPEPGQIVELCGDNKVRIASADSDMVIGVSSNTYWVLAGCSMDKIKDKTKVAIGIAGQLPIRVQGPVKYGDFIVCSGNGIGEARSDPKMGQIAGRAMESNDSPGIKLVNCIL